MSTDPTDREPADDTGLLGAADIVTAFTALRHELKLQVRAGRELASGLERLVDGCLDRRLGDVGERLARAETTVRPLALALAEIEESLERAVVAITIEAETIRGLVEELGAETGCEAADMEPPLPSVAWDACLRESSWLVRTFAAGLVGRLRHIFDEHVRTAADDDACRDGGTEEAVVAAATSLADARQGLELVLVRTRRLMEQAGLRRIDVLHEPFDAEQMRAIDISKDPAVPEGRVAEQFRPGYLLHGTVLRPAEVGVSRGS